jgi:hypothetical protein
MIGRSTLLWTIYGSFAGILLACFFYILEHLFHINLYTFLLNIDFLPLTSSIIYSQLFQFLLHLFISISLLAFTDLLYRKSSKNPYLISIFVNIIFAFTFFPLYSLSIHKPFQPPLLIPFFIWLFGHLLYAFLIGYFVFKIHKRPLF